MAVYYRADQHGFHTTTSVVGAIHVKKVSRRGGTGMKVHPWRQPKLYQLLMKFLQKITMILLKIRLLVWL
jgi:hypothetical protein